jgi:pyruvate/2-oxoglutarate dehydrogenase complex dihydrolipoamide dehydrogenase (E3) component
MTVKSLNYDLIVIGGGSAGFNAARTAANLGKRVAVVDGAKVIAGLCILNGCMPSKTLIYSTEILHLAQHGKVFGLRILSAKANMKAIHARKKKDHRRIRRLPRQGLGIGQIRCPSQSRPFR